MSDSLSAPYDLTKGQTREVGRLVTNGVWLNHRWRMIGWGDLTDADLAKIARQIPFGELFIVVTNDGDYSLDGCLWMIERGTIYRVLRHSNHPGDESDHERMHGVRFRRVIRPTAQMIIERFRRLNMA